MDDYVSALVVDKITWVRAFLSCRVKPQSPPKQHKMTVTRNGSTMVEVTGR